MFRVPPLLTDSGETIQLSSVSVSVTAVRSICQEQFMVHLETCTFLTSHPSRFRDTRVERGSVEIPTADAFTGSAASRRKGRATSFMLHTH